MCRERVVWSGTRCRQTPTLLCKQTSQWWSCQVWKVCVWTKSYKWGSSWRGLGLLQYSKRGQATVHTLSFCLLISVWSLCRERDSFFAIRIKTYKSWEENWSPNARHPACTVLKIPVGIKTLDDGTFFLNKIKKVFLLSSFLNGSSPRFLSLSPARRY